MTHSMLGVTSLGSSQMLGQQVVTPQHYPFPPLSAPPLLPPLLSLSLPTLRLPPDYCDLKRGKRNQRPRGPWAAGGPCSVALQTLTKYASEELCLFVVVLHSAVRDPKAPVLCLTGWCGTRKHRPAQTAGGSLPKAAGSEDT